MRSLGRILAGQVWSDQVGTLITDAESPNGEYEVVGNFWGEGERIYAFEGLLCLLVLYRCTHNQTNLTDGLTSCSETGFLQHLLVRAQEIAHCLIQLGTLLRGRERFSRLFISAVERVRSFSVPDRNLPYST